jgi:hypothetical protein
MPSEPRMTGTGSEDQPSRTVSATAAALFPPLNFPGKMNCDRLMKKGDIPWKSLSLSSRSPEAGIV